MLRTRMVLWGAAVLLFAAIAIVLFLSSLIPELTYSQPQPSKTVCCSPVAGALSGTDLPSNIFTSTLTLPSGWINTHTSVASFSAITSDASLSAGALSNDGVNWEPWLAAANGQIVTTTWNFGDDGTSKPVYLRLKDANGRIAESVHGTVNVDTTPSVSSIVPLPPFSPRTFTMSWFATDATSGVASYDLQVRVGTAGSWTAFLTGSTVTSATYDGAPGETYYFRVRATDFAGNVEPWRTTDVSTTIPQTD